MPHNHLTHWPLEDVTVIVNFTRIKDRSLEHFHWNCPLVNATRPHWWLVNIGCLMAPSHYLNQFSDAKSILAGIPLTNALGENRQFSLQIMFISCPFNSAIVWYVSSKFAHMYLCGIHYQRLWPNCCKCDSFGDIDAINWDNPCRGPNGTSAWPRSLHEPWIHCG